jgi:hypothetical protein
MKMDSFAMEAASGAMRMAAASAAQAVGTAVLRKQLDTQKEQASLLLDTFERVNQDKNHRINTVLVHSVKPHLGSNVDIYI